MQSDYARQYEDLWKRHWWWRSRERFVLGQIEKLHRRRPFRQVLDAGCGNGLFFKELQRFGAVRGVEPDAGLVTDDGPFRAQIEVRPFDASYRPPQAPDLVLMLDVLEHIEDDLAAARHVREILAPRGIFLVTVPALMWLWSRHDDANRHFRRYTRASLRRVLAAAGFRVRSVRYFFGWTIGPMLLRRLLAPGKKGAEAAYHVAVPAAPVNGLMFGLSRFEQLTIGRWGLLLGSSLIAVAERAD
jgi:SAM-dependent methyltransferase